MKGYLHIESPGARPRGRTRLRTLRPHWEYDKNDPDEDFAVERLRRVYVCRMPKAA